jgi:chromate transporter
MAMHIGLLAGWCGFLVAGLCFILPAALLVGFLAWLYVNFGALPQVAGILYWIKPVIIAVVLQALWRLGRDSLKSWLLAGVALLAGALSLLGVDELLVLLAGGVLVAAWKRLTEQRKPGQAPPLLACVGISAFPLANVAGGVLQAVTPFSLGALFFVFLKIGAVLFGSGYVLLAFLRADLVERLRWLEEKELLDAIAVGQVTPGPVFTTATFIGYVLAGPAGAVLATVGIFLPAFFFVAVSGPLIPRLRRSPTAGAFLDGVVMASLALMAVVTWELGKQALVDIPTRVFAALSAIVLLRFRVNSIWLVLAGALLGLVVVSIRGA